MHQNPKTDRLPKSVILGLGTFMILLTLAASAVPFLHLSSMEALDFYFYDRFLCHVRPEHPYTRDITIVDIDETSLHEVGQWPWPRYRLAQMIAILAAHSPKAMGLDIVFPEPDRLSLSQVTRQFKSDFKLDIHISNVPQALTDNDDFFGQTIGRTATVGARYYYFDHQTRGTVCRQASLDICASFGGPALLPDLPKAEGELCNVPKIETRLSSIGFINSLNDGDGLLRRTPILIRHGNSIVPHLSLALFMKERGITRLKLNKSSLGLTLEVGPARIPITRDGYAYIGFNGPARAFKYISALDILTHHFDPSDIRGKTILMGSSAMGLNDIQPTVFDPNFPGIEVSAVLLDNMATQGFIRLPDSAPACIALCCILIASVMMTVFYGNQGPGVVFGVFFAGSVLVLGGSLILYAARSVFISPALPLGLTALLFVLIVFARFVSEKRAAFMWYRQLSAAQQLTMELMASMVETRDPETGAHIVRTQHYARAVAFQLQRKGLFPDLLTDRYIDTLFLSVPLHDIGKVGIPDRILLKPGKLNKEEFDQMKQHTTCGRKILSKAAKKIKGSNYLAMAEDIVCTHHEKWNGTGYPQGLAKDEIPLSGRIMAIADVYDALISKRCYKQPFSHEKAISIIKEERGQLFDPLVVDAFMEIEPAIREIADRFQDEQVHNLFL